MKLKKYIALTTVGKDTIFLSKLNVLYKYSINNNSLEKVYSFSSDIYTFLSKFSNLLRRLFRKDIRYAIKINNNNLLLVKNGYFIRLNLEKRRIESKIKVPRGSRPLNMTIVNSLPGFDSGVYFGEYFNSQKDDSVKIYNYTDDMLKEVYEFRSEDDIEHIHNLVVDSYRNCIWILTGDFGKGTGIYKATNNFESVECVVRGKQKYRSCVAFPTEKGLIYATDSQFEQNYIKILYTENDKWKIKNIFKTNGPCIYGTLLNDEYYFSTSVEATDSAKKISNFLKNKRGPGVIKNQSEIVKGNLEKGFEVIYTNEKDVYPFVLFQFGNIIFPSGINNTRHLFFTNIALKSNDFTTMIIPLDKDK